VPALITCFACEREPEHQCSRCGRPYCDEHGEELCDVCMSPASGVPPNRLYVGSIFALVIGTVLAIIVFIQPSESSGDAAVRPFVLTPTTAAAAANPTAPVVTTAAPNQTAAATTPAPSGPTATRPPATGTVTAAATATRPPATATTAAGASGTYTVVSGDTLSAICEKVKPASMSLTDCLARMVTLNSLSSQDAILSVGQTLNVPR
jgi:nucleoid-associated protein YgaU